LIGAEKNTGYGNVQSLRKDKRAVSPAISTVILTAAVVVMILVAMSFANTFLDARIAENEFSTNKQFMLTTGLQIDDIAWTIGRTQTVRYSSKYGNMKFQSPAVNYTFEVYDGSNWETLFNRTTGMILFNIPVSTYSISNNYFERISPSSNGSFLQQGPSAPVSHVFCVEKLPMIEGNYTRIVAVPSIRMLNSTIEGPSSPTSTNYFKFYLPTLEPGTHLYRSQSITMTGNDITKIVRSGVNKVRITVTFPNAGIGFDSGFFNFDHISETITLLPNSVVEFYVGKVIVTLGQV
jgi:predicted lactoylglutathione lyase